jgi:hypothetical protein
MDVPHSHVNTCMAEQHAEGRQICSGCYCSCTDGVTQIAKPELALDLGSFDSGFVDVSFSWFASRVFRISRNVPILIVPEGANAQPETHCGYSTDLGGLEH